MAIPYTMSLPTIPIEPSILSWARESLGLSIEEVASRLKRNPAEIAAWETGSARPTYAQLERLAERIYKRPLALFFLPEPPEEPSLAADFRTMNSEIVASLLPQTRLALRKATALQFSLREIVGPVNPNRGLLDIHFADGENIAAAIERVRIILDLDWETQQKWNSSYEALNDLRRRIEANGVFVFQFPLEDIRGFALHEKQYPIIGLSSKDLPQGRIFTLLHELCHLLYNDSDLFLDPEREELLGSYKSTESDCNRFAAEFLVPTDYFIETVNKKLSPREEPSDQKIAQLAQQFKVGRMVIVRKLLDAGWINQIFYWKKQRLYISQYKGGNKPRNSDNGPGYYTTKVSRLGHTYLNAVFDALDTGRLTPLEVAQFTGTKIDKFSHLLEKLT